MECLKNVSSLNTHPIHSAFLFLSSASSGKSSWQIRLSAALFLVCPEPPGYHEALAVSPIGLGIPPLCVEPKLSFESLNELTAAAGYFCVWMSRAADSEFYSCTALGRELQPFYRERQKNGNLKMFMITDYLRKSKKEPMTMKVKNMESLSNICFFWIIKNVAMLKTIG